MATVHAATGIAEGGFPEKNPPTSPKPPRLGLFFVIKQTDVDDPVLLRLSGFCTLAGLALQPEDLDDATFVVIQVPPKESAADTIAPLCGHFPQCGSQGVAFWRRLVSGVYCLDDVTCRVPVVAIQMGPPRFQETT